MAHVVHINSKTQRREASQAATSHQAFPHEVKICLGQHGLHCLRQLLQTDQRQVLIRHSLTQHNKVPQACGTHWSHPNVDHSGQKKGEPSLSIPWINSNKVAQWKWLALLTSAIFKDRWKTTDRELSNISWHTKFPSTCISLCTHPYVNQNRKRTGVLQTFPAVNDRRKVKSCQPFPKTQRTLHVISCVQSRVNHLQQKKDGQSNILSH